MNIKTEKRIIGRRNIIKDMKAKLITITILRWLFTALYLPFYLFGLIVYYLSKLMRATGFILIVCPVSAKNELSGFWNVYRAIGDILKK